MKNIQEILRVVVVLLLLSKLSPVYAQGTTAFTYQGQLKDNGTNASGTYAMTFKLFDAISGGAQIGGSIANSTTLANGLFTVNLDFGANAFNGNARWLDITVQVGANTPETLTPRVQVLPTPYAQFAAVAASVANGAIGNAQLAGNSVNANNIAGGQVVKNLNGLVDIVALTAGANMFLTTNGNTLQFSARVPRIQAFTTTSTFVVPTNVAKIMVEMWGGGGNGGNVTPAVFENLTYYGTGGGGGSGAYSMNVLTVTPGASYAVTVGGAGGTSSFGNLMSASGGSSGTSGYVTYSAPNVFFHPGNGGAAGSISNSVAQFNGGDGQNGSDYGGGSGATAFRGGQGAWGGGDGGSGYVPGGGGSGGSNAGNNGSGGTGGQGMVIVYY